MEEKKQIKISLKTAILLVIVLFLLVAIIAILILNYNKKSTLKNDVLTSLNSEDYKKINIGDKIYYQRLNQDTWKGQYHQENFYTPDGSDSIDNMDNKISVVSYAQYLEIIRSINSVIPNKISNYYSIKDCNYIILSYANGYSWCKMDLIDCLEEDNKIIIYGDEEVDGVMAGGSGYFIAIPTNMPVGTEIDYRECYTSSEINNLKKYDTPYNPKDITVDKPIIYLYPTKKTKISVKLGNQENITCSYPQYTNGWNVLANTNGDLIDVDSGRNLYSLYYESKNVVNFDVKKDGFIVKGTEVAKFLEEKLAILGLTERESEEFIVYWLPKLQENEYNYIRFATMEEINANMPLYFSVEPDILIRILMTYKGLDKPIDIQEQQLEKTERTGFVAVEWGGTEIK